MDLWCWKQPLYQLSRNHLPSVLILFVQPKNNTKFESDKLTTRREEEEDKQTNKREKGQWVWWLGLVERSLPTPEIHGSNVVIGNFIYYRLY